MLKTTIIVVNIDTYDIDWVEVEKTNAIFEAPGPFDYLPLAHWQPAKSCRAFTNMSAKRFLSVLLLLLHFFFSTGIA